MQELIPQLYKLFRETPVVTTDSRKITKGCLFFGLKGEHVDGSKFGAAAIDHGAGAAIVSHGACEAKAGVVFVDDPLATLQQLAQYHRGKLSIPIIAITGSNGKTTTKELIFRVLATTYAVRSTHGNLNNHIGVPLTLLSIAPTDQIAIIEMGANHPGEIQFLCHLAEPTHGTVTNIGKAHLEGFGGFEGVKRTKAELYDSLERSGGIAYINRNEPYLKELSAHVDRRIFFGFDQRIEFNPHDLRFVGEQDKSGAHVHFCDAMQTQWTVHSNLFGAFNLANIATAIAVGLHFNVEGARICNAISSYIPDNNRAQRLVIGSNTFIMDAYNANPTSMASAIESFRAIQHPNKYLVLGAMMELGIHASDEHLEVVQRSAELADTTTLYVGEQFKLAAAMFRKQWFLDVESLTRSWTSKPPENALILVKGSRAMHLETLLAAFQ